MRVFLAGSGIGCFCSLFNTLWAEEAPPVFCQILGFSGHDYTGITQSGRRDDDTALISRRGVAESAKQTDEDTMRAVLGWFLEIPIPILILLYLFHVI